MVISYNDKHKLKELAKRVQEHAKSERYTKLQNMWYEHNALKSQKPMVIASPEGAWREILTQDDLTCEGELARSFEYRLLMTLYMADVIKDDTPIDDSFNISWQTSFGDYGFEVRKKNTQDLGAFKYEKPVKDLVIDYDKLHYRSINVDKDKTFEILNIAKEVFDGLLNVKINGGFWWTLGMTAEIIKLIGLEELMLYMYDKPKALHKWMAFYRDEHLNMLDYLEKNGLLCLNNRNNYVGSGGYGYTNEIGQGIEGFHVTTKDMWGFCESQETVGISPEMFGEFIFPYQLQIMERFGLNCYGCCEPVESRWEYLKTIPNLRRVSVSPWCNEEIAASQLKKDYIYSRKPNPSYVCIGFDEDGIKKDLQRTMTYAKNCNLEIILKDTHTVENHPERFSKWVEIARSITN